MKYSFEFFQKQCTDAAGHLAVKFEKTLLVLLVLCALWSVAGFYFIWITSMEMIIVMAGFYLFGYIAYCGIFVGFFGAYTRSPSFLYVGLLIT